MNLLKLCLPALAVAGLGGCAVYPAPAYESYNGAVMGGAYAVQPPVYIDGAYAYPPVVVPRGYYGGYGGGYSGGYYGGYARPYYRPPPPHVRPPHGPRPPHVQGRPGGGRGDRDRDGIPNRFDRDRDGDGVPNRQDRRPGNPRQR